MSGYVHHTIIDPARIAEVLDYAEQTSVLTACRKYGHHQKTVYRWIKRRAESGGTWPTPTDVAEWPNLRRDEATRKRKAARQAEWRKAVYLNRGTLSMSSLGARRRLHALVALGHTYSDVAKLLGVSAARVSHLAMGKNPAMLPRTAVAIDSVYRELCMTRPEGWIADRQRAYAISKRWAPPLAWENIDDPKERAKGRASKNAAEGTGTQRGRQSEEIDEIAVERRMAGDLSVRLNVAEKVELFRRSRLAGISDTTMAKFTGLTKPERYTERMSA